MQAVKSTFISLYVLGLVTSLVIICTGLFGGKFLDVYYIGALVACSGPIIYFVYIYAKKPKSVSLLLIILSAFTITGFLITLGQQVTEIKESALPFQLALSSFLGWVLYLIWYGKMGKVDKNKLLVQMDEISFEREDGSLFSPSNEHDFHLYILYRGYWCPFCVSQLEETMNKFQSFEDRNVELNFVSTKVDSLTKKLIDKYNLPINLLVDPNMTNSTKMGLNSPGALPLGLQILNYQTNSLKPAVVLTNRTHEVIGIHQTDDYKKRPEPEFFIRIIDHFIRTGEAVL